MTQGSDERQLLLARQRKLPTAIKPLIELIALTYGNATGLLVWRCLTLVAPIPATTASDLFIMQLCSLVGSSGIINLCRQHLYDMAKRVRNSNDPALLALWHEFTGSADMDTQTRVLAGSLKLFGSMAEGCIAYATAKEVLKNASAEFQLGFSIVCGVSSLAGFPFVEGGGLNAALSKKTRCNIRGTDTTLRLPPGSPLKNIVFPDNAILAAANSSVEGHYGETQISSMRIIGSNIIVNLGAAGIATLAVHDVLGFLKPTLDPKYGVMVAIPIAGIYFLSEHALRGLGLKLAAYGIHPDQPKKLCLHNPFSTIFAGIQSTALGLIPFIALQLLYWLIDNPSMVWTVVDSPVILLVFSTVLGLSRLPMSFINEGLGLIKALHEEGHPIFNLLMNLIQFAGTASPVALQMSNKQYDVANLLETYAIAGGVNLAISFTRHGLLAACIDPRHSRDWHQPYSPLLYAVFSFLIPAVMGACMQALFLWVIMPKEPGDTNTAETVSSIIGGLIAGLSAIFARIGANKLKSFYKKRVRNEQPSFLTSARNWICRKAHNAYNAVSNFFGSWCYSASDKSNSSPAGAVSTEDPEGVFDMMMIPADQPTPRRGTVLASKFSTSEQ